MTLVVARQFGDRIIVLSDTMISDPDACGSSVIPGRLKSVIVSNEMAISYAGLTNQAIDIIRDARSSFLNKKDLSEIITILVTGTQRYRGLVDFIVATHMPTPALHKVADGQVSSGSDFYWIGDSKASSRLYRIMNDSPKWQGGDPGTAAEMDLTRAFIDLVCEHATPEVGGFCFNCLGSPLGYRYQNHAGDFSWYPIQLGVPYDEEARRAYERTGTASYSYSLTSATERGLAVTGAFLPQADLGYLYSPLDLDDPTKLYPVTLQELSLAVNRHAARLAEKQKGGQAPFREIVKG